jgi:PAS domain S-box-containing protein
MAALTNHPVKLRSCNRKTRRAVCCLLVAITALWGVTGLHAANEDNTIVLRLKWWHQFQFAGFYAAEAKGYYQEAGLTVRIEEGAPNISAINAVLAGDANFGVSDSSIALRRLKGQPLVACASILQHAADVILTRQDRQIRTPSDLLHKKVMLSGDQGMALLIAMLVREGLSPDSVKIIPSAWNIEDLITGRVDAMLTYATEEPIQMRIRGVEPAMLRSTDYGVDFYGDTLFTTTHEAEAHPERTAAFIHASLRGWDYALRHPEEIADLILKMKGVRERHVTRQSLMAEAEAMAPYILSDVVEIGHMNPGRWEKIARTFFEVGMAPSAKLPEAFIFKPTSLATFVPVYVLRIGAFIAFATLVVLLWNLQIRRRVNQRTRQLKDEVLRRTRTETDLRDSEERFRLMFTGAATGIAVTTPEGRFLQVNPSFCTSTGYTEAELLQVTIHDILHSEDRSGYKRNIENLRAGSMDHFVAEARCINKHGDIIWQRGSISLARMSEGVPGNIIIVAEDITARRHAEETASANAELLRMANHIGGMGAWAVDFPEEKITWSEEVYKIHEVDTGYRPELKTVLDFYRPASRAILTTAIEKGDSYDLELEFVTAKGNARWVRTTCASERNEDGTIRRLYGIFQDITEKRLASGKLAASEAQYRLLFTHNPLPMWVCQLSTQRFLAVNDAAIKRYGYSESEFLNMTLADLRISGSGTATVTPFEPKSETSGRYRAKDGSFVEVETTTDEIIFGGEPAILTMGQDVTELVHVNRAQRMLSACNEALIRAESETALLNEICRIAVEIGGYRMAWVGFAVQDEKRTIRPVAHAGIEEGYLAHIELSWREDLPTGQGPAGRTIREGRPTLCEDIDRDDHFLLWREQARQHGYRSAICLPLSDDQSTHGVLGLHSADTLQTSAEEITLLQQLSDDLAFGIKTIRARIERQKTEQAVLNMAHSMSSAIGAEFFDKLTQGMVATLGADIGIVAMMNPLERTQARTLSVMAGNQRLENFTFSLIGAPCENVPFGESCIVPRDVQRLFPDSFLMKSLGAEAYVGNPIINSSGVMIGIMAVIFRRPLEQTDFIASTLRIFTTRAGSELDRQHVDSQLREQAALLDKAQDAIIVRDLDHRINYWNKSAERLYGWTAQEAIGQRAAELLYKEYQALESASRHTIAHGEWIGELHQVTKAGASIVVECRWTLVRDEAGTPRSILAINTDVTEKRKIEHQLLRAQRMESIGTLAGGIAHDLNNVLAPVIMATDLLKLTETDTHRLSLIGTIASSARRGADMVSQVLSFARGVEGRRIEIQPRHLIHDIDKITQETFPKNICIETSADSRLWAVTGDPTQLHQVLLNLCVNARDAMPQGGTLTITASNVVLDEHYAAMNIDAKPGPYVLLQVEDTGTGIAPDLIEKIFDPFFTTKAVGEGTGLGLSTTLAIVKSHGGFIRVYSEKNSGAQFRIHLPAIRSESTTPLSVSHAELPRGLGETVLLIDDEAAIRNINRQILETFGYRVILAADGAEGVTLYADHQAEIAVVVIDMMMPVMDGPSAIRSLVKINPAVRIIAASGITTNASAAKAAGPAVKHFLPKPYTTEILLKTLRTVIDSPSAS